jgi:5-methylcytosine-specific restriction endonuclease McrA
MRLRLLLLRKVFSTVNQQQERGRAEARRTFSIAICAHCGNPAIERHHKDGNAQNNSRENVIGLCKPCHDAVHGTQKASAAWKSA